MIISKEDNKYIRNELNNISEIESVEIIPLLQRNIEIIQDTPNSGYINSIDTAENKKNDKDRTITSKKVKINKTVRVDIGRLDNLMNLVSELIIIKTRLEEIEEGQDSQDANEAIEYLERITTSLHDAVMKFGGFR